MLSVGKRLGIIIESIETCLMYLDERLVPVQWDRVSIQTKTCGIGTRILEFGRGSRLCI